MSSRERDKIQRWQEVVVYKIIDEGTRNEEQGMSLETIQQRYVNEAAGSDIVDLKKEELQIWPLRKVLNDLMVTQLVYKTADHKCGTMRSSVNPRAERTFLEDQAKLVVLNILSREGGKYGYLELGQLVTNRLKITNDEYNSIMNSMMAFNLVIVGIEGKLWSLSSVPRKQP